MSFSLSVGGLDKLGGPPVPFMAELFTTLSCERCFGPDPVDCLSTMPLNSHSHVPRGLMPRRAFVATGHTKTL